VTDSDIINFANLTWDHFYAHTDITSLQGSIFEKRAAHGYFILAAAAGLFVHPHKGPVGANYGFEDCRFIRPIYHNDTIYARLTCKEKVDRDSRGKEHPSGVVKWFVEVFDQDGELAAFATILTLVQKKAPFADIDRKYLEQKISELREDAQPQWGMMTAQHMVEHLEQWMQIGLRKMEAPLYTPEEQVEKYQDSLYNYHSMPKEFSHPHLKKGELEELRYESMADARKAFFATYDELQQFFKENPEGTAFNPVFGELNAYEWYLCERKHIHHHFGQFGLIPSSRKEVPAKS
jgi:oxepin-CoA hydrolase/3-oxo-5,6-dehydrosuberyl-CoA semialdehyde dehydrogenase